MTWLIPFMAGVAIFAAYQIIQVIRDTFNEPPVPTVQDEIDEETEWLRAVQRATRRDTL